MSKIRINDLARELEVKSKAILDVLVEVGVTEKKTHSSSVEEHEAEKVRAHFRAAEAQAAPAKSRAGREADEIKTKIDLSHISKPGDVLKLITKQQQTAATPAPPPVRPPAPPAGTKAAAPPAPAATPPAAKPAPPPPPAPRFITPQTVIVPWRKCPPHQRHPPRLRLRRRHRPSPRLRRRLHRHAQ